MLESAGPEDQYTYPEINAHIATKLMHVNAQLTAYVSCLLRNQLYSWDDKGDELSIVSLILWYHRQLHQPLASFLQL